MTSTCRLILAVPLFLAVASAGCNTSNSPATASGKFTYQGQPVTAGSVTFYPVATKSTEQGGLGIFTYPLKADGTYSGTDLPVGEYVVTVETESANPDRKLRQAVQPGGGGKADPAADYQKKMQERGQIPSGPANTGPYVKIPPKYADKKTSTLKATLTKGSNTNNFDLTD